MKKVGSSEYYIMKDFMVYTDHSSIVIIVKVKVYDGVDMQIGWGTKNAYRIFKGELLGKHPPGTPRRVMNDNIQVHFRELNCESSPCGDRGIRIVPP
jgi:hypothetical protein